jgi:hypothetical protein
LQLQQRRLGLLSNARFFDDEFQVSHWFFLYFIFGKYPAVIPDVHQNPFAVPCGIIFFLRQGLVAWDDLEANLLVLQQVSQSCKRKFAEKRLLKRQDKIVALSPSLKRSDAPCPKIK